MNPLISLATRVVEAEGDQVADAQLAHVAKCHRRAGRCSVLIGAMRDQGSNRQTRE
jgi:hypothetical protein